MLKHAYWLIPVCLMGQLFTAKAQDMSFAENEEFTIQLQEVATAQRQTIFQGLDSLRKLAYSEDLHTEQDSFIYDRLRKIQREVPLGYNDVVKSYIDKYISRNYNPYMSKLQGLADYYFPIYEQILKENDLPDEIKFISVVESSLDPHLVSRSGAVGLWQFMFGTARSYDLTMDSYVDERKDPYAASYAASRYFKDAYAEFGDWLLALASYNCGRGCVRRAIERSGLENPDFWALSPFLPKETQNYIPKYVAMTYALKYAEAHGIQAAPTDFDWEPRAIMVEHNVSLQQVAAAMDLPLETVKKFNPSYKKAIVRASAESPKRIILPETETLNDSLLYAALYSPSVPVTTVDDKDANSGMSVASRYKVRKGETLASVSRKFGVSVQDLRSWNGLTAKSAVIGRTLVVQKEEGSRFANNKTKAASSRTASKSTSYTTYTVKKGDTLSHIAARFKGSTVSQLKKDNNLSSANLRIGQKLRVKQS